MKKIILSFFLVAGTFTAPQLAAQKCFVELAAGSSVPLGRFSNKAFTGPGSTTANGLALPGFQVLLSAGLQVHKQSGPLLAVAYFGHRQSPAGFEMYFNQQASNGTRTSAATNQWNSFAFLAGWFHRLALWGKGNCSLLFQLTAGVCKTALPGYRAVLYNSNGTVMGVFIEPKRNLSPAFCFQPGASLRRKIGSNLQASIQLHYFQGAPKITYGYNPTFPNPAPPITIEKAFRISALNVALGLGAYF